MSKQQINRFCRIYWSYYWRLRLYCIYSTNYRQLTRVKSSTIPTTIRRSILFNLGNLWLDKRT